VRWVQNGIFSPRCIMNSWKTDGATNSPWLHPAAIAPIREAIRLRYRLLPYLYTLFQRAAQHGEPWLRPTFYDFDSDRRAFDDCDDFMCGGALLVASVVAPGECARDVYLPLGPPCWYAFDTGARYAAGEIARVDAPLDRIPLFCPAGAIVPMTDGDDFSRLTDEPSRSLRVFPAPGEFASSFTLYEDDGLTLRYREGDFAELGFEMTSTHETVRVRARVTGAYALPYRSIRVVVPASESRRLVLDASDVVLTAG